MPFRSNDLNGYLSNRVLFSLRLFLSGVLFAGCAFIPAPAFGAESAPASLPASHDAARLKARLAVEFVPDALRRAAKDLAENYPGRCKLPDKFEERLIDYGKRLPQIVQDLGGKDPAKAQAACHAAEELLAFQFIVLLANPLLDFDRIVLIRRTFPDKVAHTAMSGDLGFPPLNSHTPASIPLKPFDNEIAVLSHLRGTPQIQRLFKPEAGRIVRDLKLDFDAKRLAFSNRGTTGMWSVSEIQSDGTGLRQLTPNEEFPDVDFFGPCYLPNGKMLVCSDASYQGLPCEGGGRPIANLYLLDPANKALRQLAFDQDSDAYPSVLKDGRVMYLRWEYSDIPHYFSRRVMTMNPDGTGQVAIYGSNSQFPTTFLFAKQIPDHPSRIIGVMGGHHDVSECGRLALLDPGLARNYPFRYRPKSKDWSGGDLIPDVQPPEKSGFLQTIPGYGKPVVAHVCDSANHVAFRKEIASLFAHPYPLSGKYFLAAMKPTRDALWGIYLVDIFDNQTLLAEVEGEALLEPIPLQEQPRPPEFPDRVQPENKMADVRISDIYNGPGLQGVPRGTIKNIRVFSYHFAYNRRGGHNSVGVQSSWDIKRILGTATVEADGSAFFKIPANTPVSLQPLDAEGRAVQLMRSWLVGMPGEHVSCVGCHEERRSAVPQRRTLVDNRAAEDLKPAGGGPRPFAFTYEVYPVLEKYCIACHRDPATVGPRSKPSFKDPDTAYKTLHPYVHRPGPESDSALLVPMEYHATTSPLIRMLELGHQGVKLSAMDDASRRQIYAWIDLNAPFVGSWNPPKYQNNEQVKRRRDLSKKFANTDEDPEAEFQAAMVAFQKRPAVQPAAATKAAPAAHAGKDSLRAPSPPVCSGAHKEIDLGNGQKMTFVQIPTGAFVMGSLDGATNERPRTLVRVEKPFWMSVTEVTNGQYGAFDPAHDTRYIDMHGKDHGAPGYIANHPDQPVARVSWQEAMKFGTWLSDKAHVKATLPTEAQWEWAARAGTETQFFYGTIDTDFSPFANLADQGLRQIQRQGSPIYSPQMNFPLHDERFKDKSLVVDYVGKTTANPWGLKDMVGNVSEWTLSSDRPYPYRADDGRNDGNLQDRKIARGGSWADRPADAGSAVRRAYESWQQVYDMGFRVILED